MTRYLLGLAVWANIVSVFLNSYGIKQLRDTNRTQAQQLRDLSVRVWDLERNSQ